MRRLSATVASLRPFPFVSVLVAALLVAADLSLGATGGVLLLAAFVGSLGFAIGDRIRRATAEAKASVGFIAPPDEAGGGMTVRDGGMAVHLGSLGAAGKERQ